MRPSIDPPASSSGPARIQWAPGGNLRSANGNNKWQWPRASESSSASPPPSSAEAAEALVASRRRLVSYQYQSPSRNWAQRPAGGCLGCGGVAWNGVLQRAPSVAHPDGRVGWGAESSTSQR